MTKKKIRKEVERLRKRAEHNFDISLTENERQFWLGEFNVLTLIGKHIDTLQEEPVSDDERIRKQTLKVLNYYKDEEKSEGRMPTEINECIAWLKSLGDRVKDKELTWEDIRDILDLYDEVTSMDYCSDIYGEVLKRFKEKKGNNYDNCKDKER